MTKWTTDQIRNMADQLVGKLEKWHVDQNRGPLAKLRRGISVATTRHEAWPVLGWLFGEMAVGNMVFETVAGCFALYPFEKDPSVGNFGQTMWHTITAEKRNDPKEPHTRFRQLLACQSQQEICRRIHYAVRLAKSKEAPINYRQLFADLWRWNDRTKIEWAKAYWEIPAEPSFIDIAEIGTLVEEEAFLMPE